MQRQPLLLLSSLFLTLFLLACSSSNNTSTTLEATPDTRQDSTTETTNAVDGANETDDVETPTDTNGMEPSSGEAATGYTGRVILQTATSEIHSWDLATGNSTPLAVLDPNATDLFAYGPVTPSRNGSIIAYEKRTLLKLNQVILHNPSSGTDSLIPTDGGEATIFSTQPAPSDSGSVVFVHQAQIFNSDNTFVEQSGSLDIALWDGATIRLLTDDEAEDAVPQISADGETVIFMSKRDRSDGDFYRLSVNGDPTPTRLSIETDAAISSIKLGLSVAFRMTPDGSKILFPAILAAGGEALYVMDTTSGALTQLVVPEGMQLYNFDISADGSIVAFSGINLNAANPLEGPVYIVHTNAPDSLQTVGESGTHGALTLHPDGSTIFVIKTDFTDDDPYQLIALDIEGGSATVLATDTEKLAMASGRLFYIAE